MTHEDSGKLELLFAHLAINNITAIKPLLIDALDEYYTIRTRLSYNQRQEANFIKRLLYHVEREEWIQAREHLNAAQEAYQAYTRNKLITDGYSRKIGYSQIHGRETVRDGDSELLEIEWSGGPDKEVRQTRNESDHDHADTSYNRIPKVENQYDYHTSSYQRSSPSKRYIVQHTSPSAEEQGPDIRASFLKPSSLSNGYYPGSYSKHQEGSRLKLKKSAVETETLQTDGITHSRPRSPPSEITVYRSKKADTDTLFDPNKPYNIAEAYHNLYEHEWHKALTALHRQSLLEETAIECLMQILHEAYSVCDEEARSQIVQLEHAALNIISDGQYTTYDKDIFGQSGNIKHMVGYRKEVSELSVKRLQDTFLLKVLPIVYRRFNTKNCEPIDEFGCQCVMNTWRMVIQEPPLHLDFNEPVTGQLFDAKIYKPYRRSGNLIEYSVWPSLRINKNGAVLCRGIVQCK